MYEGSGLIPAGDIAVMQASGHGEPAGIPQSPALLVVDVTWAFVGRVREPVIDAARRSPFACGEPAWRAVDVIAAMLPSARAAGWPVVYTRDITGPNRIGPGRWADKGPSDQDMGQHVADLGHIVDAVAPEPSDVVLGKAKPSAFFGTPLLSHLIDLGCDGVVVVGGTTSGCVRATAIDAFSYDLRVGVVADAVFDRSEISHEVALFDLDAKYADVVLSSDTPLKNT